MSSSGGIGGSSIVEINDLIVRMLNVGQPDKGMTKTIKEIEIIALCAKAREVFMFPAAIVELEPPVRVCGDTHGQYGDGGFPPTASYLFLGDYVVNG
ncbi:hypothetical protein QR680_002765 [Steinernema hermaphroditum]|uniref:protein-serine/threonine phosphatase n=1 Tax=Steinernema hermaphroditum TaxID=289476 RepID=A0AA39LIZ9_9BILA|nr:hypothetical protein QR680_002765 [Steinernema hermaphroditum]